MSLVLAGCGWTLPLTCSPNEHPVFIETLYFGTAKPGGTVAASEWESFVHNFVMPEFPEGLSSWEASGRWRMATGIVEQEVSHVLQLTHDGNKKHDTAIQSLMQTYEHKYQQEAVMRIRSQGCRSF
ncbi:MAG TPA: DUF3574 domain-containing protein [Nitrospira sp.]|jgi:hypothetical protein|nr:DUF3574 domain-containing protein [Nitrospira sp.]